MKIKIFLSSIALLTITLLGFKNKDEISNCFIAFNTATGLTATKPDRLPETAEKTRTVTTEHGEVEITRLDGYRVLYNNDKGVPFVNLKVELSAPDAYATDQQRLIENLEYSNHHSIGMETKELIGLQLNGYKIWGLSRGSIEAGSTLGTFIMFPGKGITVYFYFNNLKPGYRNFESLEDYKKQRDRFLEEYTRHLSACKD